MIIQRLSLKICLQGFFIIFFAQLPPGGDSLWLDLLEWLDGLSSELNCLFLVAEGMATWGEYLMFNESVCVFVG